MQLNKRVPAALLVPAMLGLGALALTVPNEAKAGLYYDSPVYISTTAFYGSFQGTRDAGHQSGWLYCASNGNGQGWCGASNGTTTKVCNTSTPQMVETIRSMTALSEVEVQFDSTGRCTYIATWAHSRNLPLGKDL